MVDIVIVFCVGVGGYSALFGLEAGDVRERGVKREERYKFSSMSHVVLE